MSEKNSQEFRQCSDKTCALKTFDRAKSKGVSAPHFSRHSFTEALQKFRPTPPVTALLRQL
jgi:hypothetical protein